MKKITFLLLILFFLVVIGNTIFSILSLWSKKDVLIQTQNQLIREEKEHRELLQRWQTVRSQSFIEEEARNKLFLGQPGDIAIIMPKATISGQVKQNVAQKPTWLLWWELFF